MRCIHEQTRKTYINNTKDHEQYRQILIRHAVPSGTRLLKRGFILGHDNDPKHTAARVKNYLSNKEEKGDLKVLAWPSQSPDLNPIEHLWKIVKQKRIGVKATSADDLFQKVTNIWNEIPITTLKTLIESMPRRVQAVIDAKGQHTKY